MNKPLTMAAVFLLIISASPFNSLSVGAQNKRTRFDPSGAFWISGEPPAEFSDFSSINLNMRNLRRLPTTGLQLNDGTSFRFRTVVVKQNNFTFTTETKRGLSYGFAGKFLKGGDFAATWMGEETPVLEGTLTRFKDGKKVADAKMKFIYFGGT
jgi:hypothetical protein